MDSFNINTNQWMAMYVFKRLKWLGNKQVSLILTLVFISFWHGFWPGYHLNFSFEFIGLMTEINVSFPVSVRVHVLMRDEKEERKQEQTNNKAKQHSTPKAVTFPKKNELPRVGLEPTTLYTPDRACMCPHPPSISFSLSSSRQ